jgi:hypothetical protein
MALNAAPPSQSRLMTSQSRLMMCLLEGPIGLTARSVEHLSGSGHKNTYCGDEIIDLDLEDIMIDRLPPDLLRSFVAVAQTGSFTRAAERVHLSQSTVSQHINRLEDLVGKLLFERDAARCGSPATASRFRTMPSASSTL